jgi:hypothetical protein
MVVKVMIYYMVVRMMISFMENKEMTLLMVIRVRIRFLEVMEMIPLEGV